MPPTERAKRAKAKWPWRLVKVADRVMAYRLAWQPTWGLPLKNTMTEYLGDYPSLAAAIAAIAETQE